MAIKTKDLKDIIMALSLTEQPAGLFFGRPGIGKTEAIKAVGRTWPHFVHMDGTQMAYEAIQGVNFVADGTMKNAAYAAIKQLEELHDQEVFVFIDEVSSLDPDDQRTLLNIINDRVTPNGVKLTGKMIFILAANPGADQRGFASDNPEAAVNNVEQAIVTRCFTQHVVYNVRDYIEYGSQVGVHPSIIKTLNEMPDVFERYNDPKYDSIQVAVPRTLSKLSELLWACQAAKVEVTLPMFEGFVGNDAPVFKNHYDESMKTWVDFADLVKGDAKAKADFMTLSSAEKGAILVNGVRQSAKLGLKLNEPSIDTNFADILMNSSIGVEYLFTMAQIQAMDESIAQDITFGPKVNGLCGAATHMN